MRQLSFHLTCNAFYLFVLMHWPWPESAPMDSLCTGNWNVTCFGQYLPARLALGLIMVGQ